MITKKSLMTDAGQEPIRSARNYSAQAVSLMTMRDFTDVDDPIVTVQDNSVDINVIASQARATGQIPYAQLTPLTHMDLDVEDYADGLRKLEAAKHAFMLLPPDIRAKFDNDPSKAQAALAGMSPEEAKEFFDGKKETTVPETASNGSPGTSAPSAGPGPGPGPGESPPGSNPGPNK